MAQFYCSDCDKKYITDSGKCPLCEMDKKYLGRVMWIVMAFLVSLIVAMWMLR